jgi:hypothetical protein
MYLEFWIVTWMGARILFGILTWFTLRIQRDPVPNEGQESSNTAHVFTNDKFDKGSAVLWKLADFKPCIIR